MPSPLIYSPFYDYRIVNLVCLVAHPESPITRESLGPLGANILAVKHAHHHLKQDVNLNSCETA